MASKRKSVRRSQIGQTGGGSAQHNPCEPPGCPLGAHLAVHLADMRGDPQGLLGQNPPRSHQQTTVDSTPRWVVDLENVAVALVGRRVCCFPVRSRWGWVGRRFRYRMFGVLYAIPPPGEHSPAVPGACHPPQRVTSHTPRFPYWRVGLFLVQRALRHTLARSTLPANVLRWGWAGAENKRRAKAVDAVDHSTGHLHQQARLPQKQTC